MISRRKQQITSLMPVTSQHLTLWCRYWCLVLLTMIVVSFVHTRDTRRVETKAPWGMVRREWATQISVSSRWR